MSTPLPVLIVAAEGKATSRLQSGGGMISGGVQLSS